MDAEENKFVSTHLRQHNFITGRVWLGMQTKAQSLKWLDGSEVKYANWAKGKENASGECGVMFSANGTWTRMDCKNVQSRVVCKAPQSMYAFNLFKEIQGWKCYFFVLNPPETP
ncbi:lymphocyte antigen 75-like [Sceloporus undulatus]|uniref:lymphocyte antigen 75-like n=1 Tax=Sceloporus undulatus TaxID=8520 RepID=UPI001C4CE270|nr:lymphocyte antigen 75-like [Sceloporus undulatus]